MIIYFIVYFFLYVYDIIYDSYFSDSERAEECFGLMMMMMMMCDFDQKDWSDVYRPGVFLEGNFI